MKANRLSDSVGVQTLTDEVKPPASLSIFKGNLSSELRHYPGANPAERI